MAGHTTSNPIFEPARSYKSNNSTRFVEATNPEYETESNWLNRPSSNKKTLPQSSKLKGRSISLASEVVKPAVHVESQRSQVPGVVIKIDEMSVRCELYLDTSNVDVQLPRSLFPEQISYGLPIWLEMIEENGIRQPQITTRKADTEKLKELKAEIAAILEEF